jgi:hypothetical protein
MVFSSRDKIKPSSSSSPILLGQYIPVALYTPNRPLVENDVGKSEIDLKVHGTSASITQ